MRVTGKRIRWLSGLVLWGMMVYAVWNIAAVRRDLVRAEEYRLKLTEETVRLRGETERLEREIALAEDAAVIEHIARTRLGLVQPGEIIFCGID